MGLTTKHSNENYLPHFASYYRWLTVIHLYGKYSFSDSNLLDIGCDDGFITSSMPSAFKVGVDILLHNPQRGDVHYISADAGNLPFTSESFERILGLDFLEHIGIDNQVIDTILRVLAPQGKIILSTPSNGFSLFPKWITKHASHSWGHVRIGYSYEEIRNLFPKEAHINVRYWNEPAFRSCYIFIRLINSLSSRLAQWCIRLCFWIDKHLPEGTSGHIFIEASFPEG